MAKEAPDDLKSHPGRGGEASVSVTKIVNPDAVQARMLCDCGPRLLQVMACQIDEGACFILGLTAGDNETTHPRQSCDKCDRGRR